MERLRSIFPRSNQKNAETPSEFLEAPPDSTAASSSSSIAAKFHVGKSKKEPRASLISMFGTSKHSSKEQKHQPPTTVVGGGSAPLNTTLVTDLEETTQNDTLTSKRLSIDLPEDPNYQRKLDVIDYSLQVIDIFEDISKLFALVAPNVLGVALGKITAILEKRKQMIENKEAWRKLLISIDEKQRGYNEQLAKVKTQELPSELLNIMKQYAESLEKLAARVMEQVGVIQKGSPEEDRLSRIRKFANRFLNADSDADAITACESELRDVMHRVQIALEVYVAITINRVDKKADYLKALISLDSSSSATERSPFGTNHRECLKDTRVEVLEDIRHWRKAECKDGKSVYCIGDVAGTGKSTIAYTIAKEWSQEECFSFFFSNASAHKAQTMCISLAKQVLRACDSHDWDEYWATQSSEVLAQVSQNVKNMWEKLVYLPLGKCTKHARHVLIVDALDECDQVTRIPLLKCLLQACTPKSEPQIYLLLTTRKEDDILNILNMEAFRNVVVHLSLRNSETSPADVARYVEYRLDETGVVLTTEQREKLIHRCNGLFIFASLACDLLRDQCADDQPLLLKDILEKFTSLDALYHQTLSRVGNISEYMRERLMGILCIVLVAREPLSIATIAKLLSMSVDAVNTVVKKLGSILGSSSVDQPVYILHATLGEFLIRKNWVERGPDMIIGLEEAKIRSNRYYISKEEGERIMLRGTFANVMAKELVFNICRLETSSLLNEAVTDMNSRVNRWISSALRYSCIHWASHLESTPYDNEILGDLQNFMKNQFLSWLEVLSATKNVQFAAPMLTVLTEWLRVKKHYSRTMAEDMYRFVTTFVSVIAQSLPHIYLSALPFAPRASLVSQCYARSYYSILMVRRGGYSNWPPFQNVLFGHTNQVWSVKFSPDGKCIVSGSEDKTIRVWDVETGQAVGTPLKGHTGMINSITVSPDSKCIVSGSEDRTIQVWDIETGEAIRAPLEAHNDVITSVSFSPDGKRVVSGSRDRTLRVWDAETWLAVGAPFQGHTGEVTSVVFSPDGKHIGSCSWDKTVRVWDVETGKGVGLPFKGHTGIIWSVSFSPDGRHIASGSMDWTVLVWDVMSGQVIKAPFKGHGNAIRSVAFSPDGKYIVSGSQEWTIRVWDVETGQTVGVPFEGHDHGVSSVVFSPDGKRIASSSWDKTVRLWDFASRRVTRASFEGYATRFKFASFMPDDKRIISVSIHTDLQIWHAETGRPVGRSVNCYSTHVLLSPDGRRIAFASHDQLIRIYDLETWQELGAPFKGHTAELMCVVFSPDGKRLASGSRDRTVRVWDIETGLAIGLPLEGHTHDVLSVAFSPDGKRIASGSPDMTVRIWDVETGQAAGAPLKGHTDMVRTVAFSPDGRRIISGSEDKTIRIWDGETGHAIGAPFEGYNDGIYFVTFSPDGEHIISGSGDGIIRFWDTETGQTSGLPYDSHRGAILHISFSSDGKRMVSASLDGTVRLWDITMNKSKSLTSNTQMKNGWIVDSNSKLLFCVPPQFRAGLLWGNNLLIIGGVVKTELNFSSFVYGKNWARFKQPRLTKRRVGT